MSSLLFGARVLAVTLLWLVPAFAHANEAVLGPPKAEAVDFKPERPVDPLDLMPIEVNGRWGFADRRGDVVVEPIYEWVDYFYGPFKYKGRGVWLARYMSQGRMGWLAFYENRRRNAGLMKGEQLRVIKLGKGAADRYSDGYAAIGYGAENQRRHYLIGPTGDRLSETAYTGLLRMIDGLSAVQTDEWCGFMDKRGKVAIPMEFAEVRSFWDGLAAVRQMEAHGGAWGFIDKSGKLRFRDKAGEIEELRSYHEGLAAVKVHGKWGFMDKRQRTRIKPTYDEVRNFAGGCAAVRRGDEWGFLDVSGKEIAWGFDGAWYFEDATRTGLPSNTNNDRTTPLGLIRQGGGYGYISRTGRVEIKPKFENALPFFRRAARVKCGNSFAYINRSGRLIWDPRRVSRFGVRGVQVAPAVEPRWPGLPRPDGSSGEPFPFEYDVEDHLPIKQKLQQE